MLKAQTDQQLPDITNWFADPRSVVSCRRSCSNGSASPVSLDTSLIANFVASLETDASPVSSLAAYNPSSIEYVDQYAASSGVAVAMVAGSSSESETVRNSCHHQYTSLVDNEFHLSSTTAVAAAPSTPKFDVFSESSSYNAWLNQTTIMETSSSSFQKFQFVLMAETSPLTRRNEETVTFLNQGQSYELKFKKANSNNNEELYKSIIRVVFHDRRLQYIEREQMNLWRQTRPGERVIDIDVPLSCGLLDIQSEPDHLNCIEVIWNANKQTSAFIKVHCISTEFTEHKHGGEKGVPFRIQVETYALNAGAALYGNAQLVHCSSCQVKVFKPKGADRKQKRDSDKLEKASNSEKVRYLPVYPYTLLTEIPLDQVTNYLLQLSRSQNDDFAAHSLDESSRSNSNLLQYSLPDSASCNSNSSGGALERAVSNGRLDCQMAGASGFGNYSRKLNKEPAVYRSNLQLPQGGGSNDSLPQQAIVSSQSPGPQARHYSQTNDGSADLLRDFDAMQLADWLRRNRFGNYVKVFENYSGSDLLCLSKEDMIELCGLADGIRLNNATQSKTMRPRLTLYFCKDYETQLFRGQMEPNSISNSSHLKKSLSWNMDKLFSQNEVSSESEVITDNLQQFSTICADNRQALTPSSTSTTTPQLLLRTVSMGSFQAPLAPPGDVMSHRVVSGAIHPAANVNPMTAKRRVDMRDRAVFDDQCSSDMKKRRHESAELEDYDIHRAIFLEFLTSKNLAQKIAAAFDIALDQVSQILMYGPSAIRFLVTDSVVQNIPDQSCYLLQILPDTRQVGRCIFVLRPGASAIRISASSLNN